MNDVQSQGKVVVNLVTRPSFSNLKWMISPNLERLSGASLTSLITLIILNPHKQGSPNSSEIQIALDAYSVKSWSLLKLISSKPNSF